MVADVLCAALRRASPISARACSFIPPSAPQYLRSVLFLQYLSAVCPVCREGYHDAHIDEMIALCQKHSVSNVTFAVHSLFAQQAAHRMLRLLHACPQSTMTFWGLADSQVHRWLDSLDEQRTYRDTLPPGWGEWVSLVLARALGYLT